MSDQSTQRVAVCLVDEFPSGTARKVTIGDVDVAVVRIDGAVFALADECSHGRVSLSEGEVWCDELEIECPKHGSTFSLISGEPNTLPATQPVAVYDAAIVDGQVIVTVNGGEHS